MNKKTMTDEEKWKLIEANSTDSIELERDSDGNLDVSKIEEWLKKKKEGQN